MSDIIGQPYYEFYNLLPFQREEVAQELFNASLGDDSVYRVELVHPKDERFYYVISERGEDGKFIETSRNPAEWAAAIAVAGAWDQQMPQHLRPNTFDIESMGARFEFIALRHFVARSAEQGAQA